MVSDVYLDLRFFVFVVKPALFLRLYFLSEYFCKPFLSLNREGLFRELLESSLLDNSCFVFVFIIVGCLIIRISIIILFFVWRLAIRVFNDNVGANLASPDSGPV